MNKNVDFFFDFGSPTTYLAWTQLPAMCAVHGATLRYKPMLLGAVFKATGNASPAMIPSKGRYMILDMDRFARRYGVPMTFNPNFPINTLGLMRGAMAVQIYLPERFDDYLDAIFNAMWVDALNLADAPVLAGVLSRAGFDPQQILALTSQQDVKDALAASTEEAIQRGAFGAPTMFVNDELFFGQDRLDFIEEALKS